MGFCSGARWSKCLPCWWPRNLPEQHPNTGYSLGAPASRGAPGPTPSLPAGRAGEWVQHHPAQAPGRGGGLSLAWPARCGCEEGLCACWRSVGLHTRPRSCLATPVCSPGNLVSGVSCATPTSAYFQLTHQWPQPPAPQSPVFELNTEEKERPVTSPCLRDSLFPLKGMSVERGSLRAPAFQLGSCVRAAAAPALRPGFLGRAPCSSLGCPERAGPGPHPAPLTTQQAPPSAVPPAGAKAKAIRDSLLPGGALQASGTVPQLAGPPTSRDRTLLGSSSSRVKMSLRFTVSCAPSSNSTCRGCGCQRQGRPRPAH